jgi:2-(1,2-epoxy-1,2-dihydrophenyl)acetyl-CoA isomerase
MSEARTVRYGVEGAVATITLDRPESLNAMSNALMTDLHWALEQVVADESVRVAVVTGAGRGFCSGADLGPTAGRRAGPGPELDDEAIARSMDDVFHPPLRLLSQLPVPTVARVNGVVAGGGLGLALGCDLVVAARSARFVCTFGPRLGIVPDLGTTFHLPHLVGRARARGIAMLGPSITADQAAEWGLIWAAVDDDQLDTEVDTITTQLARSSPDAMTRIRQAIDSAQTNSLGQQLDVERDHQRVLIPRNMGEGAAAFMEKREPVFGPARIID